MVYIYAFIMTSTSRIMITMKSRMIAERPLRQIEPSLLLTPMIVEFLKWIVTLTATLYLMSELPSRLQLRLVLLLSIQRVKGLFMKRL